MGIAVDAGQTHLKPVALGARPAFFMVRARGSGERLYSRAQGRAWRHPAGFGRLGRVSRCLACRSETKFHIFPLTMKYSSCFILDPEINPPNMPETDEFLKYPSSRYAEEGF